MYAENLGYKFYFFLLSNSYIIFACVFFIVVFYLNIGVAYAMSPLTDELAEANLNIAYWQEQGQEWRLSLNQARHDISVNGLNAANKSDCDEAIEAIADCDRNVSTSIAEKGAILRKLELENPSQVAGTKRDASRFGDGKFYADKK